MQERETKWTPMKALGRAQKEIEALNLPTFTVDLEERPELDFSKLTNYDNMAIYLSQQVRLFIYQDKLGYLFIIIS